MAGKAVEQQEAKYINPAGIRQWPTHSTPERCTTNSNSIPAGLQGDRNEAAKQCKILTDIESIHVYF